MTERKTMSKQMTRQRLMDIIWYLTDKGISCETMNWDGVIGFDLNTGAKSHMQIFEDGVVHMRYEEKGYVSAEDTLEENIDYLCGLYEDCLYGRTYGSSAWFELVDARG